MGQGNRGKYAEGKVREALKVLKEERAEFDFCRQYDFRTSMGRIPPQTGDYLFFSDGKHGAIEVKEVQHEYRLPLKNFTDKEIPMLRVRQLAGGHIFVLVCFRPDNCWRAIPFDYVFDHRDKPSMDLREFGTFPKCLPALRCALHDSYLWEKEYEIQN